MLRNSNVRFENDVPVPMRDGISLSADLYLPADGAGPWPVILSRTPYDNTQLQDLGLFWAQNGYVHVAQDVRGRFDSDGVFTPWRHETEDGFDTIDWIGAQPWCDGNVGMSGASYLGQVQWQAGFARHPLLKTIVPRVMGSNLWESAHYQGGAFGLGVNALWGWGTMGRTAQRIDHYDWPRLLRTLPLRAFEKVSGKRHPSFASWLEHEAYDDYWKAWAVDERYESFEIPVLQVCGWYDLFAAGAMHNFAGLRDRGGSVQAREQSKIIMGPWTHDQGGPMPSTKSNAGDREFGVVSMMDTLTIELAWFDRWLKGIENRADEASPIKLFVMGANVWRDEMEWPLARTEWTSFYFHSGGNANTLHGDGVLDRTAPGDEPEDRYVYDPDSPVPTTGGCNCCTPEVVPWGAYDQRDVEARPDVLVYTTPPLERDLEATGPVVVHLFAATDGLDTDFTAKLVDVFPDGTAWNLCDGIVRGRFRDGRGPARPLAPGGVEEFTIDLWVTANVFKTGRRIRVEISSSNFPRFDRNLNTGDPIADDASPRIARQRVLHDAKHPSRVVLPVIPA